MAVRSGDLEPLKLFKIFRSTLDRQMSGVLTLKQGSIRKKAHVVHGVPIRVTSNLESEGLLHALVQEGLISSTEKVEVERELRTARVGLDEVLVRERLVAPDRLRTMERRLATGRLLACFAWTEGRFTFEEIDLKPEPTVRGVDVVEMLVEAAARILPDQACVTFVQQYAAQAVHATHWLDEYGYYFDRLFPAPNLRQVLQSPAEVPVLVRSLPDPRVAARQVCAVVLAGLGNFRLGTVARPAESAGPPSPRPGHFGTQTASVSAPSRAPAPRQAASQTGPLPVPPGPPASPRSSLPIPPAPPPSHVPSAPPPTGPLPPLDPPGTAAGNPTSAAPPPPPPPPMPEPPPVSATPLPAGPPASAAPPPPMPAPPPAPRADAPVAPELRSPATPAPKPEASEKRIQIGLGPTSGPVRPPRVASQRVGAPPHSSPPEPPRPPSASPLSSRPVAPQPEPDDGLRVGAAEQTTAARRPPPKPVSNAKPMPANIRAKLDEALRLAAELERRGPNQEQDHFKILGVTRSDDENAIKNAFRRLARDFHVDKYKRFGLPEEQVERIQRVFMAVNKAHEVLTKPDLRAEYLAKLDLQGQGGRSAQPGDHVGRALRAERLVEEGLLAIKNAKPDRAIEALDEALSIAEGDRVAIAAKAYATFMQVQGRGGSPSHTSQTRDLLEKITGEGMDREEPWLYLGRVYRAQDDLQRAAAAFQKAIEINRHCAEAQSELRHVQRKLEEGAGKKKGGGLFGLRKK